MLLKPIITEKSMQLAHKLGQFTFGVSRGVNKDAVKQLIETAFSVNVLKVRIVKLAGKSRRSGKKGYITKTAAKAKAIITLKPGQMIEYFELPKARKEPKQPKKLK